MMQPKAAILMYHQICERKSDPWELAVQPHLFDAQLSRLKKKFNVVPLQELAEAVSKKNVKRNMVSITFDDCFEDNYVNARPLLQFYTIPATFYCSTHATRTGDIFWWEKLEEIILHKEELPETLTIEIGNDVIRFKFQHDHVLNHQLRAEIKSWNATLAPPNERVTLFLQLWKCIQPLHYNEQSTMLKTLEAWAGAVDDDTTPAVTMNIQQLANLSANPLFTIGAHTVHHAMLAHHTVSDQMFEVRQSKMEIEQWIGKTVNVFAYPYGNYTGETKKLLRQEGFHCAVSTAENPVTVDSDLFELPRIQVKNWNPAEFYNKLKILMEK